MRYLAGAPDSEIEGRKGPALLWEEMERTPRGCRSGRPHPGLQSTATCHMQPESHLFPVTLNKMLATPVGPMSGQNQMDYVLHSFYPTAKENELYLWGNLWPCD